MQTAASEGRVLLSLVSAEPGGGGGARLAGWLAGDLLPWDYPAVQERSLGSNSGSVTL